MVHTENDMHGAKGSVTRKSFPMYYGLWSMDKKKFKCILTYFCCPKYGDINTIILVVQKLASYPGSHKCVLIYYALCLEKTRNAFKIVFHCLFLSY